MTGEALTVHREFNVNHLISVTVACKPRFDSVGH
jgi:hypothetical protein